MSNFAPKVPWTPCSGMRVLVWGEQNGRRWEDAVLVQPTLSPAIWWVSARGSRLRSPDDRRTLLIPTSAMTPLPPPSKERFRAICKNRGRWRRPKKHAKDYKRRKRFVRTGLFTLRQDQYE